MPAVGTATASAGYNSQALRLTASVFSSASATAVAPHFQWQAEPVGNDTASPSGTLNLLASSGTATPAETGLKIASNGQITFASGQTFPGTGTGNGTITGVTAGTDLTGGGTSGKVTLNVDTTKVPQLATANTFTGNQFVNGTVIASTSVSDYAVLGTGPHYGVYGTSGTQDVPNLSGAGVVGVADNYGVYGSGTGTGPGGYGVYGTSSSTDGAGVFGSGVTIGVFGGGGTTGYGVEGDGYAGVVGYGTNIGVYGSGDNYGVWGTCGETNCYAGYFQGNVDILGTISKSSGSFKIDHPLDPANKYLYHSFVESPDMMNIYNGNVILDKDGTAWITLPGYFGALNRDFRYQLTAIGAPGPNLYIAQEISDNRFQIAGGTPGGKVSWQVTGIRQDAYAKVHPIIPEVEKTGEERGKYLHPVEHGLPKSLGINESRQAKMLALHQKPPKLPERAAGSRAGEIAP
jgi:hypothetical protein